jgi:hypothetical protein
MNPRKKESKKWSALPPDLAVQIKKVFEENFKAHLVGKTLKVEGRIYPTEVMMRVGINNKGELRYNNFEVSLDHSVAKENTVQQIHVAVDAIASLMADYFENEEEHEMPLVWAEYPFYNQKLWLQYSSVNPDLEAEANKLLGLDEAALLNEDETIDAELENLEETEFEEVDMPEGEDDIEIGEDEDIDTSRPKIFRVPTDNPNDSLKKKKKEDMH